VKKFVALTALALMAAAGTANAQFRLDLSMTARAITVGVDDALNPDTNVLTDIQTGGSILAAPGQQYVIEVRYRIADLVADTTGSTGLTSAQIHISGSSAAGSVGRYTLTNFLEAGLDSQGNSVSAAVLNPDNSNTGFGSTGLVNLYRGGLTADGDASNGNVTASNTPGLSLAGFDIVPLALALTGQKSFNGANPTAANTNNNPAVWALFDFIYTVGGSSQTLTAAAVADPQTGNTFAAFLRQGTVNNPVPVNFAATNPGSITFTVIPAPASAALMGIGGLVAFRRRRA